MGRITPQHISLRFEAADVVTALAKKDAKIADLKAEMVMLRSRLRRPKPKTSDHSHVCLLPAHYD